MTGMPGMTATTVATAIMAVIEARGFRDDVIGGDGKDRAGQQAGAERADAEEGLGILAGERGERLGGVGGAGDGVDAVLVERCSGGDDDDERGDEVGEDRAGDRLALLVGEVLFEGAALDGRRLQVELHVGRDRRAGGGDDQQQVRRVVLEVGDEAVGDLAPVRVGEDRRDRVGEERDRQPDEHALGPSGTTRGR